eukprot:m.12857 g.12857  ORF g.12857 m.12857 type:complete len:314 (+) comp4072_c0_seq1:938-1879(+)
MEGTDSLVFVGEDEESVQVYLLGTAHISEASALSARNLILSLKPKGVLVELCRERSGILEMGATPPQLKDQPSAWELFTEALSFARKGKKPEAISSLFRMLYAKVSADMGGIVPGKEFKMAFDAAREVNSLIMLGDRRVSITLKRLLFSLSVFDSMVFVFSLIFSTLFAKVDEEMLRKLLESDGLDALIQDFKQLLPCVEQVILQERDVVLAFNIKKLCLEVIARNKFTPEYERIVVVIVGKAHIQGIKDHWARTISVEELNVLYESKPRTKRTNWTKLDMMIGAGITLVGGLAVYSIAKKTSLFSILVAAVK